MGIPPIGGKETVNLSRAEFASALAAMYAVGGFFVGIALLLPHGRGANTLGVTAIALVAFVVAALLATAGDRVPIALIHLAIAAASTLICGAIYFWRPGEIASSVALLFVWVTLYAFYFLSARAAGAHTAYVAVAYALTLALQPGHDAPLTQWIVTVGTAAVSGAVIGRLGRAVRHAAGTDSLTGVASRRRWIEAAAEELARAARRRASVAVALIDLDGFKAINDEHGHAFGDRLLRETCEVWKRQLRPGDLLGRYGGDEFVVLLSDCDQEAALRVAERLVRVDLCACTIGLTPCRIDDSLDEIIQRVDAALYEGKRAGGGRIIVAN